MIRRVSSAVVAVIVLVLTACAGAPPPPPAGPTSAPAQSTTVPAAVRPDAITAPAATVAISSATVSPPTGKAGASNELILATTTSTQDSGLLDAILPNFEQKYNAKVKVVAVGTGEALKLGENGDADVVLVHARAKEDAFVAAGYGINRQDVMYNDFVIVGPADDPAGIKEMTDAAEAFKKIADAQALFISRGDDSGTHTKEKSIWAAAAITPTGEWYASAGQGMGAVLTMAEERNGYTLTDRGTYLARKAEGYSLPILVEGDQRLFNPYGVILVNPERYPSVNVDLGNKFIEWLISPETQKTIGEFGKDQLGEALFVPDSKPWHEAQH
ncbi:MAG TPA: tungstate ABC transporter [Chloroflexi bacterium]|nr:tungstate ABC transporter [Chloroflexota bacterium]